MLVIDRRPEARGIYMIEGESDGDPIENSRQPRAVVAGDEGRIVLFLKGLDRFTLSVLTGSSVLAGFSAIEIPPLGPDTTVT